MSKILIVGPAYPFRGGGITTFNERLARELINSGHECDILSFSLQYPSFLFPGKTQYSSEPPPENLKIYSLINSVNPFNWIRVGRKMKAKQYDVVVFRYWMSFMAPAFGTIARIIKQNKQTRVVTICDNLIPHEERFFDKWFTGYFISQCDGFLTMSHAVKTQLEEWPVHKEVIYTPHPMYDVFGEAVSKDEARKKLNISDERVLLFFGFIRQYKGLHLLLDAMADERVKKLNVKLVVAGEFYENSKPYFDKLEKLGLKERVVMNNDFIPNGEVATYFCAADAVIQTYLNATQSGVTQIAYYYDKPMIVTNVGGLAELVPHDKVGLVVDVDKEQVIDAIIKFYAEQKENLYIANIKTEKLRFTWETLCLKLMKISAR